MSKLHIAIDLETLGVGDNATIIQIGAVAFTQTEITLRFSRNIWSEDWAGGIEPDTMLWWMRQNPDVRKAVFDQEKAVPLLAALCDLNTFTQGASSLWANSPNFDLRLLQQACKRAGAPWIHLPWIERDVRTLAGIPGARAKEVKPEKDPEQAHGALYDAEYQARWVQAIYRMIGKELP